MAATAEGDRPGPARYRSRRERLDATLALVLERGHVEVDELVAELEVSPATVRRDLETLASDQLIIRSHGGASAHPRASALPMRYRASRNSSAKEAIARAAVDLIAPGSVIGLNGGTTTTTLAQELGTRGEFAESARPTIVVTNALNIAQELAVRAHLQLVVTGGVVRPRSFELVGSWAEHMLEQIHMDQLFLGANAVGVAGGAGTDDEAEAAMSARLADRAERVVVVADASKLGASAFARICPAERISTVITDAAADPVQVAALRDAGVEVVVAR